MTRSPGGTITRTLLDPRGLPLAVYVGTDDAGATATDPTAGGTNNLVLLAQHTYDGGNDGNLTQTVTHVDASTTRTTNHAYDWRNRQTATDGELDLYQKSYYDNLNRVVKTERYDTTAGGNLIAREETKYDERGRVYCTQRYPVDPADGSVGTALASNTWYDAVGHAIKRTQAGSQAFTKAIYDSLNRPVAQYVGYDADESSYAEVDDVEGDTIFEQTETTFDAAGNAIATVSRQRLHDATGTGALTTPGGSQPQARVSYAASWYDGVGRQTASAAYGALATAPTRPVSAPSSSDTVLVSSVEYNARGEAYKTIDPAGSETRSETDDAGRVVRSVQNYVDGTPGPAADVDVTVERTYNADGNLLTLTAKNSTTGDQVTRYVYGTAAGGLSPAVYRNDLMRAEIYPDSDDTTALGNGTDGVYDRVEYAYNRLGERIAVKDQNGTVHQYAFDALGRQTQDRVTTVGTGVDDNVLRIQRTYEVRGMVASITSYDDPDPGEGNVLNQVVFEHDDLGRLVKDFQEHEGAKDANTLYVEYEYAPAATALRLASVKYPNGRRTRYDYGTTAGGALNRLDAIKDDDASTLAAYTWLGLGRMVVEDFVEPDVKLDYFGGTSGTYAGVDRFGRVVDQKWYDYAASAVRDQYTYGYDRAGNRLWRENATASAKDEFYTYDEIHRLVNFDRGTLNATKTAVSGTPTLEQDWTLDPTGNWAGFVEATSGTTDLSQSRTHNPVNEITDIAETQGTAWLTPVHDRAGNMTTVPKPSSLVNGLACTYDAWNRLVAVEDASASVVVARYEYDGNGHRIKKHVDSQSPADPDGIDKYEHFYYVGIQCVETRDTTTENDQPENLQPIYQYVWSNRYIDALVLRDKNTDADGLCDDERLYYLTDANFNVTALVDANGDAVERYTYSPYGKVTIHDATWTNTRNTSSYDNQVLYTGRRLDGETGLYFYRARYYSAELGRFVGRDPVQADFNLYRYCYDNPTIYVDPSGLACTTQNYPSRTWSSSNTGHFGSFVMGLTYTITQSAGSYTVCDTCCANGATGKSVTFNYSAHVDVTGSIGVSWQWNGLLGLGVLNAGVTGEIYARGQGDLNFAGTLTYCPPATFGGTVKACGNSFSLTVGGRVTGWANVPGYSLSATIAGAVTYPAHFCASVDVGTGTISGAYAEITGPGTGGIRFYGSGTGVGFNKSFDTCLLGNCTNVR